ncbi:MAG: hypothetical protein K2W82_16930 [Candidatus Obscuribacterales bacterium]|nr:hypothetical protein [Candidatus Obscuribacterales bacterium]
MKRINTLLSLLAASALVLFSGGGTGHAQAGPLVKDPAASKVDITIYGNRLAQVQETRTVQLQEGTNRILLDGIATNYRPDSLRVLSAKAAPGSNGGHFSFLSATYQPATLTVERILSDSVGKEVEVFRDKEGIKGKLLSYAGGYMTIDTGNGEMRLVSSSDVRITQAPVGLSNTAAVVVEAQAGFKAGAIAGETASYELTFSYETTGLGWSAKHNLVYDDVASKLESWQTVVSVVNNTGTSFENATLRLLTSAAAGNDAPGGMYKLRAAGAPMEMADAAPGATVESVGDQKTYTVPGKVQLVNGQTRQILLLEGRDVPVKREYFATVGNYSEGDNQKNVSIRLTVENCEKHNLGKALPAGQVKVYQYNSAGIQQQTGSASLGDKAQDEIFDVVIGTASDIKFSHVLAHQTNNLDKANAAAAKSSATPNGQPRSTGNGRVITLPTDQQDPVFEEQTWEVKVYNYKTDRDVEVKVEVYLPSPQDVAAPLTKKSATEAFTHVKAGKSSNSTLQYKTTIQVR